MNNQLSDSRAKVIICLGGVFEPGGMLEYAIAWAFQEERDGNEIFVLATKNILEGFQHRFPKNSKFLYLPYSSSMNLKKSYIEAWFKIIIYSSRFRDFSLNIEGLDPDKIHIIDETIFFPILRVLFKNIETKKIITIHDPEFHPGQFRSLFSLAATKLSRLYIKYSEYLLHYHSTELALKTYGSKSQSIVINHPPPPAIAIRNRAYLDDDLFEIGFLGRYEPYKGLDLIPELSSYLKNNKRSFKIIISGQGKLDKVLESNFVADNNISYQNKFITDKEFHQTLANLDLLILPYKSATQSGVLFMANTYKIPVVAFNVGAFKEAIKLNKSISLVEPDNKKAFFNAVDNEIINYEKD